MHDFKRAGADRWPFAKILQNALPKCVCQNLCVHASLCSVTIATGVCVLCLSGILPIGVCVHCPEMWCVLVEWWDVVCTSRMVGCGAY